MDLRLLLLFSVVVITACQENTKETETENAFLSAIQKLPDSIHLDNIVIHNLYKNQLLAHKDSIFDERLIIEKVYKPHQKLWDDCYGMIFEKVATSFNSEDGMITWNKTLYPENKDFFDKRTTIVLSLNVDSLMNSNLKKFKELVPYKPQATISFLFTPYQGIGFGGCANDLFALELNNIDYDIKYTLEHGIPHELNHFAYDIAHKEDPSKGSALYLTIDEGFASYFTYRFFDKNQSKSEAVEQMTDDHWQWYLNHEKEIFTKLKPYFSDLSGDNPLVRNEKYQTFPDAPHTIYYWLGFRIVERYIETHGEDAWQDLYTKTTQEILDTSGYQEFIDTL